MAISGVRGPDVAVGVLVDGGQPGLGTQLSSGREANSSNRRCLLNFLDDLRPQGIGTEVVEETNRICAAGRLAPRAGRRKRFIG